MKGKGTNMTKKDYELAANEIFNSASEQSVEQVKFTVELLSRIFKKDNPLFNPDKFERACYEGKHIRKSISGKG